MTREEFEKKINALIATAQKEGWIQTRRPSVTTLYDGDVSLVTLTLALKGNN